MPLSCAPTLFRRIYSRDRKSSSRVNVALKKCNILALLFDFLFDFLLLRPLLLKAQFNLVPADILKNHSVHPVIWQSFLVFQYLSPNKRSLHHKYANKGFYEEFALQWFFVATLWNNEVGGTCKMNIETALKSRNYILDLDHVKLSLGIFFFLSCLIESIFTIFQDLSLFLSKTQTKKPQI